MKMIMSFFHIKLEDMGGNVLNCLFFNAKYNFSPDSE